MTPLSEYAYNLLVGEAVFRDLVSCKASFDNTRALWKQSKKNSGKTQGCDKKQTAEKIKQ